MLRLNIKFYRYHTFQLFNKTGTGKFISVLKQILVQNKAMRKSLFHFMQKDTLFSQERCST